MNINIHISTCIYIFIHTCMAECSPACKQAGVTLIGGRPNNFWFLFYVLSDFFYIYSLNYLQWACIIYINNPLSPCEKISVQFCEHYLSYFQLVRESQHIILMSEVDFYFLLLLPKLHFSMMIWSIEVLMHANWRIK